MKNLDSRQKTLALLTIVGGVAILASYALAFVYSPEIRAGLWGGVPDSLRPLYTVSMFLAAAGFFLFTYQLILGLPPGEFRRVVSIPYKALYAVYGLILLPSAVWLPLTAEMLQAPAEPLWSAIRAVLALVAFGSTVLLVILFQVAGRRGGALAWLSVAGCLAFWFQTAVLDAMVWPAYFTA